MMKKILLVEDNDDNRDMLSRRLSRKGFDVITAENGQIAIDKASSDQPDVILMDMSMPVMDGWEATTLLKSEEATRHIPVIGLSAHALATDRERALQAGCDDYEIKPVAMDALVIKINQYLD